MNKRLFSLFIVPMALVLGGCGVEPQTHEHTFSNEWQSNASSHWHNATCDHKELTKDLGDHTFINGKCSVCGFEDPNYHPEIPETYFLPKELNKYLGEALAYTYEFEYDSDLHGYTETISEFNIDGSSDGYEKKIYKFNDDYSEMSYLEYISEPTHGEEEPVWELMVKKEYQYFENNSYVMKLYFIDFETQELELDKIEAKYFNERNQVTLDYTLVPNNTDGELNKISHYYVNTYDADGFQTKVESYEGLFEDMYLDTYDEYEYDFVENIRTIKYFFKNDDGEGFYQDGYSVANMSVVNGIRFYDQIEYEQSDTEGNHNKHGYSEDFIKVYSYYGGLEEEESITLDENNNITSYSYRLADQSQTLSAEYDSYGKLIATQEWDFSDNYNCYYDTLYLYSESHQMVEASLNAESNYGINQLSAFFEYTNIESKELLKYVEIYDNIISEFSHYVLIEGI